MPDSMPARSFLLAELMSDGPNGPLVGRVRFGGSVLEVYLSDVGPWGFAYRQYLNGRFTYSERFDSEDEATRAAETLLARRLDEGWLEDEAARRTA